MDDGDSNAPAKPPSYNYEQYRMRHGLYFREYCDRSCLFALFSVIVMI